jgi:hypothetical protein
MKTIVILILWLSFLDHDLINYCAGDKLAYACILLPISISGAHVKKVCLTCTVIIKILVTAGLWNTVIQ